MEVWHNSVQELSLAIGPNGPLKSNVELDRPGALAGLWLGPRLASGLISMPSSRSLHLKISFKLLARKLKM